MNAILGLLTLLLTCVAGGIGAAARWWCDTRLQELTGSPHPWGTLVVNVSGSFVLGVLTAVLASDGQSPVLQVLGLGLLGGYTTFSSSVVQTVRAAGRDGLRVGVLHAAGTAVLCVSAAFLGLSLG